MKNYELNITKYQEIKNKTEDYFGSTYDKTNYLPNLYTITKNEFTEANINFSKSIKAFKKRKLPDYIKEIHEEQKKDKHNFKLSNFFKGSFYNSNLANFNEENDYDFDLKGYLYSREVNIKNMMKIVDRYNLKNKIVKEDKNKLQLSITENKIDYNQKNYLNQNRNNKNKIKNITDINFKFRNLKYLDNIKNVEPKNDPVSSKKLLNRVMERINLIKEKSDSKIKKYYYTNNYTQKSVSKIYK